MPKHDPSRDAALYRGDLLAALESDSVEDLAILRSRPISAERAASVLTARSLLRAASLLEGWTISLARWLLEAAATGNAQPGPASHAFETCREALDPPPKKLIARIRADGRARRVDLARAVGQCASHHGLWRTLVGRGASVEEHNRFFWTALHFAAAFGSAHVAADLLALGANASRTNAVGQTALHVGVTHGSVLALAELAAAPRALAATDRVGRTAAQLALHTYPTTGRCRAALGTLKVPFADAEEACEQGAVLRRNMLAREQPAISPPRGCKRHPGGGWLGAKAVVASLSERRHCEIPVVDEMDADALMCADPNPDRNRDPTP